jgi:ABC-type multidrug transport system fused ATPase/permease subunit
LDAPPPAASAAGRKLSSFARVRRYLPRWDGGLWLVYVCGFLSAILWPALVVLGGMITELLVTAGKVRGTGIELLIGQFPALQRNEFCLVVLLGIGLALGSLECLLLYLLDRAAKGAAQRVTTRLRRELRQQAFHLAGSELFGARETSLQELFTERMETLRQGLVAWWTAVPRKAMGLALLGALALMLNFWLTLAAVLLTAIIWLVFSWLQEEWRHSKRLMDDRANLTRSQLLEGLSQVRMVRGYMLDDIPGQPFEETLEQYHEAALARHRKEDSLHPLVRFVVLCGAALILLLLGMNLFRVPPKLAVDEAVMLYAALFCAVTPLVGIARLPKSLERAEHAADEIFQYLDREPGVGQLPEATPLDPLMEQVELVDVTLLDGSGHKLLDEVTLQIPARARVAFVSLEPRTPLALCYLLPRFYDPYQGQVLMDRKDIRYSMLASVRSQTAVVMHEGLLFTGSVAENIGCGDEQFTQPAISEAAKRARAYDFVQRLPQGFNTTVGEHGMRLTNSQQLRIGVARALLRDPTIVILEEPPDEMDSPTADLLDQAIEELADKRTLIVLPTRLNTLRKLDRVFLFHDGKLVDEGSHTELLQRSELYRHLIYQRFNMFRDGRAGRWGAG